MSNGKGQLVLFMVRGGEENMSDKPKIIHFFVGTKKIETTEENLTGAQIKKLAGVDPTDVLEEKVEEKWVAVNDEQVVAVKNKHFRVHPGGQDS